MDTAKMVELALALANTPDQEAIEEVAGRIKAFAAGDSAVAEKIINLAQDFDVTWKTQAEGEAALT